MIEAGTGVGKSFAYLVPAIFAALDDPDCRVVVSTHTISLQEQLIHKDIPFLRKVMPRPFKAVLVKGRSNYLSLRRLRVAQQRAGLLFGGQDDQLQLQQIGTWSDKTIEGSRSDLPFQPAPAVWDLVESDSTNCLGRRCNDYDSCFYFKARKQIGGAHLLVVNHALFCSDLALRRSETSILPKYKIAILDEAHTLEDVAADHLGLQVTSGQVDWLLNRLFTERSGVAHGLLTVHGTHEALQQVYDTRSAANQFFNQVRQWLADQTRPGMQGRSPGAGGSLRIRQPNVVPNILSEPLKRLTSHLDRIGEGIKSEEEQIEYEAAANRCEVLAAALDNWLEQKLADQVYWLEVSGERLQRVTLASAPIDVGPVLRELLYEKVPTVLLTSATLSAGGKAGFDFFQQRLGLAGCSSLQLGSPFDYREQVELHLMRRMPDPASAPAEFEKASLTRIQEYVQRSGGRAFVLFTSSQTMQRAANQLRSWFQEQKLPLFSQSDGTPRHQMLEKFRRAGNGVLFGVASFWQGVDVPGEALSNVIITRLPFAPPDRPIIEARVEVIEARGGQAFLEYQVPQAVLKFKQGFGRLIRSRADRGMVVILDPRVLTKPYGRAFLDALPDCRRFIDGVPVEVDGQQKTTTR
jgi:ATP-dependent DNA helicase DinG